MTRARGLENARDWAALAVVVFAPGVLGLCLMVSRSESVLHVAIWGSGAVLLCMVTCAATMLMTVAERRLRRLKSEH